MSMRNPYDPPTRLEPACRSIGFMRRIRFLLWVLIVDASYIGVVTLVSHLSSFSVSTLLIYSITNPMFYALLFLCNASASGLTNTKRQWSTEAWIRMIVFILFELTAIVVIATLIA